MSETETPMRLLYEALARGCVLSTIASNLTSKLTSVGLIPADLRAVSHSPLTFSCVVRETLKLERQQPQWIRQRMFLLGREVLNANELLKSWTNGWI